MQEEGEDLNHYITETKVLAKTCNFGNLEEDLIRDNIVSGINGLGLQERLLREVDLTLAKAERLCRAAEASKQQVRTKGRNATGTTFNKNFYSCLKCGTNHAPASCPTFGKQCNNCGKLNHYAVGCKFKVKNRNQGNINSNKVYKSKCHELTQMSLILI